MRKLAVAAVVFSFVVGACAEGPGGGDVASHAQQLVAAEAGGVVEVTDPESPIFGAQLRIPAGALAEDTMVSLRPAAEAVTDAGAAGPAVEVRPAGLVLDATATLRLPIDGGAPADPVVLVRHDPSAVIARLPEAAFTQELREDGPARFVVPVERFATYQPAGWLGVMTGALSAAPRIEGRVVMADGSDPAGSSVLLHPAPDATGHSEDAMGTLTDGEGTYVFFNVKKGETYTLVALADCVAEPFVRMTVTVPRDDREQWQWRCSGGESGCEGEGSGAALPELVLTPVGAVSGVALLEGAAADGQLGVAVFLPGSPHVALTDATGAFRLDDVPAGAQTVAATHPGWASASLDVVVERCAETTGLALLLPGEPPDPPAGARLEVVSLPVLHAFPRLPWAYQPVVDRALYALDFALAQGPAAMTIGAAGLLEWTPGYDELGAQVVEVGVLEAETGRATRQLFTLTVERASCLLDESCAQPDICEGGLCFPPQCLEDAGCAEHPELERGIVCEANRCQPGCRDDSYCLVPQMICYQHCLPPEECVGHCEEGCHDGTCPAGEFCRNHCACPEGEPCDPQCAIGWCEACRPREEGGDCGDQEDNDCDGAVDCADDDCAETVPCWDCTDDDGDGYGEGGDCEGPDCDPWNPQVHPGAPEACDGLDNDCDGVTDEDLAGGPCTRENPFGRCDGSFFCLDGEWTCDAAEPGPELCDGIDNDCDYIADEGTCDDGNLCTDDLCDPVAGCVFLANSLPCDDGNLCTANDQCIDGACAGTPIDCNDGNPCTDDLCAPWGGCVHHDRDGVFCNDDEPCTRDDVCEAGVCAGGWWDCQLAGCEGGPECCPDADGDGFHAEWCGEDDCDDQDDLVHPGAEELCDGLDNDCNGAVDDGIDSGGLACNTGMLGPCAAGRTECVYGAFTCVALMPPQPELCDALDNDCDGTIDDGPGLCEPGQLCVQGVCVDDGCPDADDDGWTTCDGDCDDSRHDVYPGATENCATPWDDDCSGSPNDEGAQGCVAFYRDEDQDAYGTLPARCLCEAEGMWNAPVPGDCDDADAATHPGAVELCGDLIDNDCDASVDEGCVCTPGDTEPCGSDIGQCVPGIRACGPAGLWGPCMGDIEPTAEVCDAIDNDCDGLTDEACGLCGDNVAGPGEDCDGGDLRGLDCQDFAYLGGTLLCAPDCVFDLSDCTGGWLCGDGWLDPGEDCDDGNLAFGDGCDETCHVQTGWQCTGEPSECWETADDADHDGWTVEAGDCDDFDANVFPGAPELCDGIDSDCDWTIDEGCQCPLVYQQRPCGTAMGVCQQGVQLCESTGLFFGEWGECQNAVLPAPEFCNGLDDDCDGATDEGGGLCPMGWACIAGSCFGAPSCSDGVQNGDETDVDCGGSCPACADGQGCNGDVDCLSGDCQGGICGGCVPMGCAEQGRECDVWDDGCGGLVHCGDCAGGETCDSSGQCVPEGVCADDCPVAGDTSCRGTSAFRQCGDWDSDPCLDWGPPVACGTGEICWGGICIWGGGGCQSDADCATADPCHIGRCEISSGECWQQPVADGTQCWDGDPCTVDEVCEGGVCTPQLPPLCDCGDQVCEPPEDELSCPADCGYCGNGVCDPGEGWWSCPEDCDCQPDCGAQECGPDPMCGQSCGTCLSGDRCEGGLCVPDAGGCWSDGDCDDHDTCTHDFCDSPGGQCHHEGMPDGAACSDGVLCTEGDHCWEGVCQPGTWVCGGANCGDGVRNLDEACDGPDLGGASCVSMGYEGGALACTPDCQLDTSGCTTGALDCAGLIDCINGCLEDMVCQQGCLDQATPEARQQVTARVDCLNASCPDPADQMACVLPGGACHDSYQACIDGGAGPVCGDGSCDTGEDPSNCSADCGTCGNGVCDAGEFSALCPQDCPQPGLVIQLVWETPGDPAPGDGAGADLDLHFLHENAGGAWFDVPWDCHYLNLDPEWGDPALLEDNPGLDIDDTNGEGPEAVTIEQPEEGATYQIGAHAYDDHGFGVSWATLRIFNDGQLVFEMQSPPLANLDLWEAVEFIWVAGQPELVPVNNVIPGVTAPPPTP